MASLERVKLSVRQWFRQALHTPLQLLVRYTQSQCEACAKAVRRPEHTLLWCDDCFELTKPLERCSRCGLTLVDDEREEDPKVNQPICGECLSAPPKWQQMVCVADYDEPLKKSVLKLKGQRDFRVAKELAQLLDVRLSASNKLTESVLSQSNPTALICVPITWHRLLQRGYNQSELLAKELQLLWFAKGLSVEVISPFKRRSRSKKHARLTKKQRWAQVRSEFVLKPNAAEMLAGHSHVAIVDDVVTTGATMTQLSRLLLEIGVKRIDIYCICRTARPI